MAKNRTQWKKSLKQPDEFITLSSRLFKIGIEQKNKITAAVGGLIILTLLISGIRYVSFRTEERVFTSLSRIMVEFNRVETENGFQEAYQAVKEELGELADNYSGKTGGEFAGLTLAGLSFSAGDYPQAIERYEAALSDFKGTEPFYDLVETSLAYAYEETGAYDKAAALFEALTADPEARNADEGLFALRRIYRALGKNDQWVAVSETIAEKHPQSMYIDIVKEAGTS
ncbi:MAG: tetratricopeptide repeat protein [Deltaproteobacteria bacterium]|nr:tetratricopeptide repeat protein [Deltaproteobacteria bacterium]